MPMTEDGVLFSPLKLIFEEAFMQSLRKIITERKKIVWRLLRSVMISLVFLSCVEEPVKESVPELITKVKLTFVPLDGGATVEAVAVDPDGEGVQSIEPSGPIILKLSTTYRLDISLFNELADVSSPEYNLTNEVQEEGEEHLFFFAWTNNLFASPQGDGNIDVRSDEILYNDEDANANPIGLTTNWITPDLLQSGTFRILLKHQPDQKSASSSSIVGETDLDLDFDMEVK
jgi:hypothetical protein